MDVLFWGVFPYICITLLVAGLIWRYRSDQYGWTSQSSQLREAKILRMASPLFHFGILFVLLGHFMGLFIPDWMTGHPASISPASHRWGYRRRDCGAGGFYRFAVAAFR